MIVGKKDEGIMEDVLTIVVKGVLEKNKYFICNECMLRGSRVRGNNDSNADVDLLVVSKDFKDMIIPKRKELVIKVMQDICLNVEIDVICLCPEEYDRLMNEKRQMLYSERMKKII